MTKSNKRKHDKRNKDNYKNRRSPYDLQYRNIYYTDPSFLPPPYYAQLPPPYYYVTQDGRRPALPPLRDSFHAKRPLERLKTAEDYEYEKHQQSARKDHKKAKNDRDKDLKKVVRTKDKAPENKKLSILKKISNGIIFGLETFFYKLGMFVACHPKKTIAVATVISGLLSIGIIKLKTDRDFDGLLLPLDSRIHTDKAWIEENILYEVRLVQFVIEDTDVLTKEVLLGMHDIYIASLNLRVENDKGLTDICNNIMGNCYVSSLLSLWGYDRKKIEQLTKEEIINKIDTTELDPTYYVEFYPDRLIGGIKRDSSGKIIAGEAAIMVWYLMGNSTNMDTVLQFEEKMIELATRKWEGIGDVAVLTLDSFREEYFDAVYGDMMLLLYVLPIIAVYTILAMGKPSMVEQGFYLVLAAVFGVILSAAACYGLCLAVGLSFGATHAGLFFLLLGIGVDDCFVVLETWKRVERQHPEKPLEEKMALAMKHAGASITVTSVSDFTAFAAGISTVMPILSSFCVYSAVGIFFLYVTQSTVFPACVILDQKRVRANRDGCFPCYTHSKYRPNKYNNIEILEPLFQKWGRILLTIPSKIFFLLFSAGLFGVMCWSMLKLDKGFDIGKSLPEGTSSHKFVILNEKYFPNNGYPFAVYCDTKDYYAYRKELDQMEQRYSNSSAILGGRVTSWIRPFKLYLEYIKTYYRDPVVLDEDGYPEGRENFDKYLYQFVTTPGFGGAYKAYIDVVNVSDINWTIYRMSSAVAFESSTNEQRLEEIRYIADTTETDGTCFAHGEFFTFAETSGYTFTELTRNLILAGVSVFVVVLLFVVDIRAAIFVVLCVLFTMVCLGGTLQFAGFKIDSNILIMTTFCIGLSVDHSAHIAYMFMTVRGTRNERAHKTLEKIGPAVLHGSMTTLMAVLVLVIAKSLTMYLFFSTLVSIMLYGMFAGLVFLPIILSLIGPGPYPDAENFQPPPLGHHWYNSELMHADNWRWRIPRPRVIPTPAVSGSEGQDSGITNAAYLSSSESSMEDLRDKRFFFPRQNY